MNFLKTLRLPYREDTLFSLITLLVLVVPIAFNFALYEKFEVIKWTFWLLFTGIAIVIFFKKPATPSEVSDIQEVKSYTERFKTNKVLFVFLLLFVLWAVFSTVWSINPLVSVVGFYPRLNNSLLVYVVWSIFLLLIISLLDKGRFEFILKLICFDAFLISIVGILQSLGVGYYEGPSSDSFLRAPSLLGNANFSTMFAVVLVPGMVYFFTQAKTKIERVYFGVSIISVLFCMVMLSSRGALVAFVCGMVVFLLLLAVLRLPKKFFFTALFVLFSGAVVWFSFFQITRPASYKDTISLSETNIDLRFFVWDIARQTIAEHPLVGVGLGNFQIAFEKLRGRNLAGENGVYDDPHNYFLSLGATGGLPLLLIFLGLVGYCIYKSFKIAQTEQSVLQVACISSIVIWCVAASFTPVPLACLLLLALLLSGCIFETAKPYPFHPIRIFKVMGQFVGATIILFAICFIVGEFLFISSFNQYFQNNFLKSYQLANLAIHINPSNQYYYIYRAGSAAMLSKTSEAIEDTKKFIVLAPSDAKTYVSASNIYFNLYIETKHKEYLEQSLLYMKQAIEGDKFFASRYGFVGYFYFLQNNLEQALVYTKASLAINPKQIPAWMLLARIYQSQDKKPQAVYAIKQAVLISPKTNLLHYLLTAVERESDIKKVPIPVGILPTNLE